MEMPADAKLKHEQTLLAPFDDHMAAAHGSHVSVTHRYRHSCKGISQISVVNKYSKAPDSGEAREVHLPFHVWSLTKNNVEILTDFGIVRGPNRNYSFCYFSSFQ